MQKSFNPWSGTTAVSSRGVLRCRSAPTLSRGSLYGQPTVQDTLVRLKIGLKIHVHAPGRRKRLSLLADGQWRQVEAVLPRAIPALRSAHLALAIAHKPHIARLSVGSSNSRVHTRDIASHRGNYTGPRASQPPFYALYACQQSCEERRGGAFRNEHQTGEM